ncbi:anti-sigma factor domain-containing protein [Herbiconiux sp. L3-i23]|uniref:anti-sigma factor n=1 Tax=Herbiconiux sp. L3-i23 TaxID=2905871 RepID=UPI00206CD788|nr:anti-sigma factor [Herbiconiux sp. L3-i23]BDI23758.1 hypothetical protein L3i23_25340 [Herbiconiux sp. L3-i23]
MNDTTPLNPHDPTDAGEPTAEPGTPGADSGAYALGALSASEETAFRERLAESEELRAEVAGFEDTAVELAATAEPVAPPPRLKADIMAMLDSVPQLPADAPATGDEVSGEREGAASAVAAPPVVPVVTSPLPPGTHVVSRRRRSLRRRIVTGMAAAAAGIAVFTGGILVGGVIGTVGDDRSAEFAALSAADDVQRISIELPAGGRASLVASTELAASAIVLDDAAALPDDETYQAWYVRDGAAISAGLLDFDGAGEYYRMLDGEYGADDVVAITREPDGGSPQPTTDPLVFASAAPDAAV